MEKKKEYIETRTVNGELIENRSMDYDKQPPPKSFLKFYYACLDESIKLLTNKNK